MRYRVLSAMAAVSFLVALGVSAVWVRVQWPGEVRWAVSANGQLQLGRDGFELMVWDLVDRPGRYDRELDLLGIAYRSTRSKYTPGRYEAWMKLPYWLPLLASCLVPVWWFIAYRIRAQRRDRVRRGLCPECGYDLRASTGRCPECGTTIPAARVAAMDERSVGRCRL
jgi:hypothetical protein